MVIVLQELPQALKSCWQNRTRSAHMQPFANFFSKPAVSSIHTSDVSLKPQCQPTYYWCSRQLPEILQPNRRPSGPEKTGQKHCLATMRAHESALVKLNRNAGEHTCFAWKQKTRYGPLYPVTAQQAKQVAAMWSTPIDSMKWRDFLLMSEFVLQLPSSASHAGIGEIR